MPGSGEFCPRCARKHLCKAKVIATESLVGHPADYWDVIGNLSEAEDHVAARMPAVAGAIRSERKVLENDRSYKVDFLGLLAMLAREAMFGEAEDIADLKTRVRMERGGEV